ncbi:MAG: SHOCT domain-containing protein [Sulfurimonadaceae bacterium]
MIKIIIGMAVLVTSLILGGCASKSEIVKVSESKSHFEDAVYEGQDFYIAEEEVEGERYRVFHQASTGFSGTSGIRAEAEKRATKFCKELDKNKKMLTVAEHTAKPPYVLGNFPRIEIIFVCIDKKKDRTTYALVKDKYEKLAEIKILLDNGTLTQEEFAIEKKKLLSE